MGVPVSAQRERAARSHRLRLARVRVLHVVRLVQHHAEPRDGAEREERLRVDVRRSGNAPAVVPLGEQRAVGGNHHVRVRHVRRFDRPPVRAVVPHNRQRPVGVRRDLVLPVGHHRQRAHDERGPRTELARHAGGGAVRVLRADDHSAHCVGVRLRLRRLLALAGLRLLCRRRGVRAGQVNRAPGRRRGRGRGELVGVDRGARSIRRDQRDHLQGLPQAHVVREDPAAAPPGGSPSCARRARSRTATSSRRTSRTEAARWRFPSPPATSSPVPGAGTAAWSGPRSAERRALSFCSSQPPGGRTAN